MIRLFALKRIVGVCVGTVALMGAAHSTVSAAEKPSELFKAGITQYASGNLDEALAAFEHPALSDKEAPGIYHNIGNAAYASGRIGKAIWAYERALLLEPRARDTRKNLERALGRAADIEGGPAPTNFFEGISAWARWVSGEEAAWFFSAAWGVWILALLARFFLGWWTAAGVAFFRIALSVLIAAGALFGVKAADAVTPRAVIVSPETYARFGPGAGDGKAFGLKEGRFVRILNRSEEWGYAVDAEGRSGWIPKDAALQIDGGS